MINTNLPPILHRFGDTSFQMSKIAIFVYPLDDLRKIYWLLVFNVA